jgi:hypothetical protein
MSLLRAHLCANSSNQMQATTSYLPGSQRSVKWAPEMLVLFWETLQCNKRFRSFIIDSNRSHDFLVLCIFYAMEYKSDASKQGVVRMCIFILQTMSAEPTFSKSLNNAFEAQETLPQSIRLPKFRGSYGDFLIMVCLVPIEIIRPNTDCSSLFTPYSPPVKETWIQFILLF